jgi:hypothetical protein
MCNTNDHSHWVVNDKYVCNYCNSESVYDKNASKDELTVPTDCRTAKGDASPCQPAANADPRVSAPKK